MIKVLAIGTFDIFHKGHLFYLRRSKALGDELYVLVSKDFTVIKVKGILPLNNEKLRVNKVNSVKFVKKAFLGAKKDLLSPIIKLKPDIISLGYDQKFNTTNLKRRLASRGLKVKIKRMTPYKPSVHKSSALRKKLEKSKK